MQSSRRNKASGDGPRLKRDLSQEGTSKRNEKPISNASVSMTPRSFVKKQSPSDVYNAGKVASTVKPRKIAVTSQPKDAAKSSPTPSNKLFNKTPIQDNLNKRAPIKSESKKTNEVIKVVLDKRTVTPKISNTSRSTRGLLQTNVVVNSPPSQRKLRKEKSAIEMVSVANKKTHGHSSEKEHQRTSTRTLQNNEIKVLKPDPVDNNLEMQNLNRKLSAKPKAFFVEMNNDNTQIVSLPNDKEDDNVSYEDDFESYESDFDSYHSDNDSNKTKSELSYNDDDDATSGDERKKNNSDEERMLDSGNFELSEAQKSKVKPSMDDIVEGSEDISIGYDNKNKSSLTDEGFLEMSSGSGVSSMKTHNEILDRPYFIDLNKSKDIKRKRILNEMFKQRAKDLLSVISLHEISYSLFEMKPIPYDLYMAMFGKFNHTQNSTQTFDDGIEQEMQTDEIVIINKWTQFPIRFSTNEVYLSNEESSISRNTKNGEDLVEKFTNLFSNKLHHDDKYDINNVDYKNNPLRIYFDQKQGVGNDKMLSIKDYEKKMDTADYKLDRLKKFLKNNANKVCNILTMNIGNTMKDYVKPSKLSFSKGYKSLPIGTDEKLKNRKVAKVVFSDTRSNLFVTIHEKDEKDTIDKCFVCLWDIGVVNLTPIKMLVALENVTLCRFRGNADGIFVGALEDGSIHLWDLSEQASWIQSKLEEKIIEEKSEASLSKTQFELHRDWNLENSQLQHTDGNTNQVWRASSYTSSASAFQEGSLVDEIVALELVPRNNVNQDEENDFLGQICSLQRRGVITIWAIISEKPKNSPQDDIGKAYWAKIKLKKYQSISLLEYIDVNIDNGINSLNFNLNLAKKRISNKRNDRDYIKTKLNARLRPQSGNSDDSGANIRKGNVLPDQKYFPESWEKGILCNDMKITLLENSNNYLVAKNRGEVLRCTRSIGYVKVHRFQISDESTTITTLQVSPLYPLFLAGTDVGTLHLCSIKESKVLLTLDCRSGPLVSQERCMSDGKGRYLGSVAVKPADFNLRDEEFGSIWLSSIQWSSTNPCAIFVLNSDGSVGEWDLLQSDIHPRSRTNCMTISNIALSDDVKDPVMAVLTADNDVQIHLLPNKPNVDHKEIFEKYISLL